MRKSLAITAAAIGASLGLLASAHTAHAQTLVNGSWESPTDTTDSTSTTVDGWTMTQVYTDAADTIPGNPGQRDAFYNNTAGGRWSFWGQDFQNNGTAYQTVSGAVPGDTYTFTSQMLFELGGGSTSGAGNGFDAITVANNPTNTANCDAYINLSFIGANGHSVLASYQTDVLAGTVTLDRTWAPYSVSGIAPAGTAFVKVLDGWTNGGSDGNTGSQGAFFDDETLSVPEPATFSLLGLGGMALLARRRKPSASA
jgi:hypothetical protein